MTQKNIRMFVNEIFSKPPERNYNTNKTDVYHIDDIWSLDILDLKDNGRENNEGYRYVSVIIDYFSNFGWTVPLENENASTITNSFEKIIISSKRKPGLSETDRGKEFYYNIFQSFQILKVKNIILEIQTLELFLQKALIELLEIFLNDLFLIE